MNNVDPQAKRLLDQVELFLAKTQSLKQQFPLTLSEQELSIASGVVLLSIAYLDLDFSQEEQQALTQSFMKRCGLSPELAQERLESAEVARIQVGNLDGLLEEMRKHLSIAERQQLYTACWEVLLADHKIKHFKLRKRLLRSLPDKHRELNKQKVEVLLFEQF